MRTLQTLFVITSIALTASFAEARSTNYVLPVTAFLNQCGTSNMKSSFDSLISTGESIEVSGSKKRSSLRQYAVDLVQSMAQGTPDEKVGLSDIVFTDFYQFPDVYPSAINEMNSIAHSFRVTFSTPSGAEYFFNVVTPTYKLVNLKLPSDSVETDGTEGSFIDTEANSLVGINTKGLCLPMKIDGSGDGRFEKSK